MAFGQGLACIFMLYLVKVSAGRETGCYNIIARRKLWSTFRPMSDKILVRKLGNLIIQIEFLIIRFAQIIMCLSDPRNDSKFYSLSDLFCLVTNLWAILSFLSLLGNTVLFCHAFGQYCPFCYTVLF